MLIRYSKIGNTKTCKSLRYCDSLRWYFIVLELKTWSKSTSFVFTRSCVRSGWRPCSSLRSRAESTSQESFRPSTRLASCFPGQCRVAGGWTRSNLIWIHDWGVCLFCLKVLASVVEPEEVDRSQVFAPQSQHDHAAHTQTLQTPRGDDVITFSRVTACTLWWRMISVFVGAAHSGVPSIHRCRCRAVVQPPLRGKFHLYARLNISPILGVSTIFLLLFFVLSVFEKVRAGSHVHVSRVPALVQAATGHRRHLRGRSEWGGHVKCTRTRTVHMQRSLNHRSCFGLLAEWWQGDGLRQFLHSQLDSDAPSDAQAAACCLQLLQRQLSHRTARPHQRRAHCRQTSALQCSLWHGVLFLQCWCTFVALLVRVRCVQCVGFDGEQRVFGEVEVWSWWRQSTVLHLQLEVSHHESWTGEHQL